MENNPLLNLSVSQLKKAADLKERIDALSAELSALLQGGGGAATSTSAPGPGRGRRGGRRQMSEEGRRRIADAARARWARERASKGGSTSSAATTPTGRKRRTMSPAARKKIAEAARARWARVHAAQGK
jgi:hypothetical protein